MTWMLRNSRGRPDALLTFSAGAVAVVLVKVLAHGVTFAGVALGSIDAAVIGALLAPTLGAYTWKRTTVDKDHGTVLPSTASATPPPRGFAASVLLWAQVALLMAIGLGIYLVAMSHRGLP